MTDSASIFSAAAEAAVAAIAEYLDASAAGHERVVDPQSVSALLAELGVERWTETGGMDPMALRTFLAQYLKRSTKLHDPHFLAHQVAVPHPVSAIADLIAGITNNGMAVYEMGPPAVALEQAMVRWLLRQVPWPDGSGVLTHGGSVANLTALLCARAHASNNAWRQGVAARSLAVLAPQSSHYSTARAVAVMGLGTDAVIPIGTDDVGRIVPDQLGVALRRARADGRRPIAVVANACSTSAGLYDPLRAVGEFCRAEEIWFHVDGCHGAGALLSPELRARMDGIELADSLAWDAHKMLRTSVLCAAVLFRAPRAAAQTFQQQAVYFDEARDQERPNLFPLALECTKSALGLKLFLVLAALGERGLRAHVEGAYRRTAAFHRQIVERPGFECPTAPDANILLFRYGTENGLQERIRQALVAEGRFYLSSTMLGSRRYLRMVVMNDATNEAHIAALLARIEQLAAAG